MRKTAIKEESTDNFENLLSGLLSKKYNIKQEDSNSNPFKWVDIIEFSESKYYLGLTLYPWQRLILKLFYMGSDGNRHLKVIDNTKEKCTNCIWNKNSLRQYSPCLNCTLI